MTLKKCKCGADTWAGSIHQCEHGGSTSAQLPLLYVIAGTYDQAKRFAIEHLVPKTRLRYVGRPEHLRGLNGEGQKVYVFGTASDRKDYDECKRMAIERKFQLEYV